MKTVKRILAIIGIILLLALYGSTLIFALIGDPKSMLLFRAAVIMTVIIPVLIWAYTFVYKLLKDLSKEDLEDSEEDEKNEKTR
jgi:uncharacterized protein YpmB